MRINDPGKTDGSYDDASLIDVHVCMVIINAVHDIKLHYDDVRATSAIIIKTIIHTLYMCFDKRWV